jgi:fatty-acyl-CoA synthase
MTLYGALERQAQIDPPKPALHFEGEDLTGAALAAQAARVSESLVRELHVQRGDRIAYLGANRPEMLVLLFALARAGAMLLPLNFRLALSELHAILRHAQAAVLVADLDFADAAQALAADFPSLRVVGIGGPLPGWSPWDALLQTGDPARAPRGGDDDPVLLVYTSGTTGQPKGAVHTQAGLEWNAIAARECAGLTRDDHVLTVLPLFHVGGLNIQTVPALLAGGTVTLHRRFDAGRWLADVATRRPTLSLLVPATLRAVLEHPDWPRTDLSSLRAVYTGSQIVPQRLFEAFHARGVPLGQVYGTTETGPVSICTRIADAVAHAGAAGRPALNCEVRLLTGDDSDAAPGETGEIALRAPNLARGYWRDPHNAAFRDGWFHTGDLARQDESGNYWIVGRSKELIVSGGENLYPAEIENALLACPDIAEVAVLGVPDARWGEAAVATVVKRPGSALDEAAVLRVLEGRLARFKHPRRVVFVESLPKTALGKVQKDLLRAALGEKNT